MIRKITESDRLSYVSMAKDFYSGPAVLSNVPEDFFTRTFDEIVINRTPYADCYIYEADGAAAGYILLALTLSQEAGGMQVWLEEIYVKPAFRGRGIGSELIGFVKKNIPAARYRLETEPDNIRAAELYKKLGFEKLGYENYSAVPL